MAATRSSKSSSSPPAPSVEASSSSSSSSSSSTTTPSKPLTKNVFRLHGVNVLNRKNVDSIARLTALERRRATHILDERQRRDTMNQLITELGSLVRESANDIDASSHSSSSSSPPPSSPPPLTPVPPTTKERLRHSATEEYGGVEKRSTVKSNSITTLRNAINEIRRLRNCAGLKPIIPIPMAVDGEEEVTSPTSPRQSSNMSLSPTDPTPSPGSLPSDPSATSSSSQQLNSPPLSPSGLLEQHPQINSHTGPPVAANASQQVQTPVALPSLSSVVSQLPQQSFPAYNGRYGGPLPSIQPN
ncbi:hypothetical protein EMPS_05977 [Entomortierella parvispora]|uniref:BHLH domain-containing protein n=1 Tax=Entomortierella parvispora TaxID=205924 RepID=A0A9P3HBE1_9FUNG|nr:hypothetical protein EMPS_05977 [Entomortierella parvispora]